MKEKIQLIYTAMRDSRTPWYAKLSCFLTLAYLISPIDLIPDFIPVIGLIDDVILLPIAIALILKMIPDEIMNESMIAIQKQEVSQFYYLGVIMVVAIWGLCLFFTIKYMTI